MKYSNFLLLTFCAIASLNAMKITTQPTETFHAFPQFIPEIQKKIYDHSLPVVTNWYINEIWPDEFLPFMQRLTDIQNICKKNATLFSPQDILPFLNITEENKNRVLYCVAEEGIPCLLKAIIAGTIKPDLDFVYKPESRKNSYYGRTPLIQVITNNHIKCTQYLLEGGANPNKKEEDLARDTNHCEIMTYPHHHAPLHCAVRNGNIEIVKLLIKHKADVNITNHNGSTPLEELITFFSNGSDRKNSAQIANLLIQNGANLKIWNYYTAQLKKLLLTIYLPEQVFELLNAPINMDIESELQVSTPTTNEQTTINIEEYDFDLDENHFVLQ